MEVKYQVFQGVQKIQLTEIEIPEHVFDFLQRTGLIHVKEIQDHKYKLIIDPNNTLITELSFVKIHEIKPTKPKRCECCGTNWVDSPSKLCPACEAYQSNQQ